MNSELEYFFILSTSKCVRALWSWMHPLRHTMWGYSSPSSAQVAFSPTFSMSSSQHSQSFPAALFLLLSSLFQEPNYFLSIFQFCVAAVVLSFWWKTGYQSLYPQLHTFKFRRLSTRKIHVRYKALHLAVFARSCPTYNKVSLPQDLLNPNTVFSGTRGQFSPQDKY